MPKPPPEPTAAGLLALARSYVDRYAPTEHALRGYLSRRAAAAAELHGTDREQVGAWVEAAVARMRALGFVDDRRWAESRARALRRRGASARAVRAALRGKGVPSELVDEVLREEEAAEPDLEAARTWARKHRIGPWRTRPVDAEGRRKELARLGRKGFAYEIARQVVDATE